MVIQKIEFKSRLSEEEIIRIARDREPQFKAISGLIQKYYVKPHKDDHYGGIYVWDSVESLKAFRESELAKSIPEAYGVVGAPHIEMLDILFQLRE